MIIDKLINTKTHASIQHITYIQSVEIYHWWIFLLLSSQLISFPLVSYPHHVSSLLISPLLISSLLISCLLKIFSSLLSIHLIASNLISSNLVTSPLPPLLFDLLLSSSHIIVHKCRIQCILYNWSKKCSKKNAYKINKWAG